MRKTLIFFLMIFSLNTIYANIIVYKTYEDYQNNVGDQYESYVLYSESAGNVKLTFKKDGKKEKVSCNDIWGFKYNEKLFRIDKVTEVTSLKTTIACLVTEGKICYWENGVAHLESLRDNSDLPAFETGFMYYFSKDISSDLYPLPTNLTSNAKKRYKQFKEKYPEFKTLLDCIGNNFMIKNLEDCLKKFEKE